MSLEKHDLVHDLPEYRGRIHQLNTWFTFAFRITR